MDEKFKQGLLADPAAALKGEGMDTPPGLEVRVVENRDHDDILFRYVVRVRSV